MAAEQSYFSSSILHLHSPMSENEPVSKRRRIPQTCRNCRVRKLKCDRRQPCEACKGRPDDCSYDNLGVVIVDKVELKERLLKAEAELAQLRCEIPQFSECFQPKVGTGMVLADSSARFLPTEESHSSKHLASTQTFIQYISERIRNLLPPKSLSDLMLAQFRQFVPGAQVILYIPSFSHEYEVFWTQYHALVTTEVQPDKLKPRPDRPFWIALLFAIFSTALRTYIQPNDPALISILDFYRMSQTAIRISLQNGINDILQQGEYFECYDLDVITAHCVNQYNTDLMSTSLIWMQSGVMVQMAHGMKLFLEPENSGYSALEKEIRRRLGFIVRIWDVAICYYQGLPSRVRAEDCTALLPSFIENFDDNEEQYSVKWTIHFGKIILLYPQMLLCAYSIDEPNQNDILRVDSLFKNWEDEHNQQLKTSFNTSDPSKLLQDFVSEFVSTRFLLLLHIPFMHSLPYSLKRGLEGARRGVELLIAYVSASTRINKYKWYVQPWFIIGSIIAVLVYIIHLVKNRETGRDKWKLIDRSCDTLMSLSQVRNLTQARRPIEIITKLRESRSIGEDFIEEIDCFQMVEQQIWPLLRIYLKSFISN